MTGNEWIGDAVLACGPVTVDRVQHLPAPVIKGKASGPLETSTTQVKGSLQPMTGRELQLLPEGLRNRGVWKFYSQTSFQTADVAECGVPDRLVFDGVTYEVHQVDPWDHVADYFKIILTRVDR
jgi:hypothetical protein